MATKKPFNHRIPVALDQELFDMIREISEMWGEADSIVMRQAMRLGLPVLRAEIERLKKGKIGVNDPYVIRRRNSITVIEDKDDPKKKKGSQ